MVLVVASDYRIALKSSRRGAFNGAACARHGESSESAWTDDGRSSLRQEGEGVTSPSNPLGKVKTAPPQGFLDRIQLFLMQGEHETVEATSHSEDEDAGQAEGGEDDEKQKRNSGRRKRRTPAELNLLRDPDDVIVELTEAELQRLAGARKLHSLRYPTYIVCTHQNFQLRAIEGRQAVKGTALKELDLSYNKLMVLDALEQVVAIASP